MNNSIASSHSSTNSTIHTTKPQGLAALTLAALGVVYGDIGTSPLYTIKEIFAPATGIPLDSLHIIGAVSTIFWSLMLVVTLKYVYLVLRADNQGEGGILALTALASKGLGSRPHLRRILLVLGLFGATLFYGDSVITPAISVLGAVEGLQIATPGLEKLIMPISLLILLSLFVFQRFGTAKVGKVFGPIVMLWFAVLAVSGLQHIIAQPTILAALNPLQAWHFLLERGWRVFAAVGAIVLALTGVEALYADMGHFGRKPIQLAWTFFVFPALALNYAGQGALLLSDPSAIANPFYLMFPPALLWPALILASLAAIIASQAVISGAYSMTRQAVQLGYLPRMSVLHTSAHEAGQIYMPAVNWTLLAAVIGTVLYFGSSSRLAGAYGIAVTLTMLLTTVMTLFVILSRFNVPKPFAFAVTGFFFLIDLMLVASCSIKLFDGGWFPLLLGLLLFLVMSTWQRGRNLLLAAIKNDGVELTSFIGTLDTKTVQCAQRVAVYMVADPSTVPQALLHNLKHYQTLHTENVILTVRFHDAPWVADSERLTLESLGKHFWKITLHYGFMESPDVPKALQASESAGLKIPLFQTSYFLSRETIVIVAGNHMTRWRQALFAAMNRNSGGVVEFFRLPDNAVVELGARVQM
jgi:KUP system potassium uptake protein